jgi:hypothetical protein
LEEAKLATAKLDHGRTRVPESLSPREAVNRNVLEIFYVDGIRKIRRKVAFPNYLKIFDPQIFEVVTVKGGDVMFDNTFGEVLFPPKHYSV